jgi:hypothetical protein
MKLICNEEEVMGRFYMYYEDVKVLENDMLFVIHYVFLPAGQPSGRRC